MARAVDSHRSYLSRSKAKPPPNWLGRVEFFWPDSSRPCDGATTETSGTETLARTVG